jgi:hypothetical protein
MPLAGKYRWKRWWLFHKILVISFEYRAQRLEPSVFPIRMPHSVSEDLNLFRNCRIIITVCKSERFIIFRHDPGKVIRMGNIYKNLLLLPGPLQPNIQAASLIAWFKKDFSGFDMVNAYNWRCQIGNFLNKIFFLPPFLFYFPCADTSRRVPKILSLRPFSSCQYLSTCMEVF